MMDASALPGADLCPECLCRWFGPYSHHEKCSLYGEWPDYGGDGQ